jgi:hypothetical protein
MRKQKEARPFRPRLLLPNVQHLVVTIAVAKIKQSVATMCFCDIGDKCASSPILDRHVGYFPPSKSPTKERTAPVAIQRWLAPGRSGPIRIRKRGFVQVPGMVANVPEKSALPCAFRRTGVVVKMV